MTVQITSFYFLSCLMVYSRAQIPDLSSLECNDDAAPLDRTGVIFEHTVSQNRADKTWSLYYTISWPIPLCAFGCVYIVSLTFEDEDTTLESWNFTDCSAALRAYDEDAGNTEAEMVRVATYEKEAPFTHRALLRIIYGSVIFIPTNSISVSQSVNIYFETPDCFASTNDSSFCSIQDVDRCGAPHSVEFVDATNANDTVTLMFRWEAPIQINGMVELQEYRTEIVTNSDEIIATGLVPAAGNIVTWDYILSDVTVEAGQEYSLVVVPYVMSPSDSSPPVPGISASAAFTVRPIRDVTTETNSITNEQGPHSITNEQGPHRITNEQGPHSITNENGPQVQTTPLTTRNSTQSVTSPVVILPGLVTIIIIIVVIVILSLVASLIFCVVSYKKRSGSSSPDSVTLDNL